MIGEERPDVVAAMREVGMSIRAIAAGIGVGQKTVQRDLEEDPTVSKDTVTTRPEKIIGLDGRTVKADRPKLSSPDRVRKAVAAYNATDAHDVTLRVVGRTPSQRDGSRYVDPSRTPSFEPDSGHRAEPTPHAHCGTAPPFRVQATGLPTHRACTPRHLQYRGAERNRKNAQSARQTAKYTCSR